MLAIRMRRVGSKKRPFFRVVVAEQRPRVTAASWRSSGTTTRGSKPAKVDIDRERVDYWIAKGARPSDTVRTLIARHLHRRRPAAPAAGRGVAVASPVAAVVEVVARALVDAPDAVQVTETRTAARRWSS